MGIGHNGSAAIVRNMLPARNCRERQCHRPINCQLLKGLADDLQALKLSAAEACRIFWPKDLEITPAGQETRLLGQFRTGPPLSQSQWRLLQFRERLSVLRHRRFASREPKARGHFLRFAQHHSGFAGDGNELEPFV